MATKKPAVRSYGTKAEESVETAEPIELEINGITVKAKAEVSGYAMLELASATSSDDDSNAELTKAILKYLRKSFDSTNWKLFERAINRDDNGYSPLGTEALMEIFNDLISAHNENRP